MSTAIGASPTTTTATRLHRHHHENSSASLGPNSSQTNSSHVTGIRSIPIRLIQYGISILLRIRAKLPVAVQPWFWVGLWLGMAVFGLAVFAGFHTRIFEILEVMATFIKDLGRA
ncbi:hypothetical protein BGX26_001295, partial [Mortierella sp. AD094]